LQASAKWEDKRKVDKKTIAAQKKKKEHQGPQWWGGKIDNSAPATSKTGKHRKSGSKGLNAKKILAKRL